MNYKRLTGGSRQFAEEMTDRWEHMKELQTENIFNAANGDTESQKELNEFFLLHQESLQYHYLIYHLVEIYELKYTDEQLMALFQEIESEDVTLSESSEKILTEIAGRLKEEMINQDMPEQSMTEEEIIDKICHVDEGFFLRTLVWLVLDEDDENDRFDFFLRAVFRRQDSDLYDRDEYLAKQVFLWEFDTELPPYQIYCRLKEIYDAVEPLEETEVIDEEEGTRYIGEYTGDLLFDAGEIHLEDPVTPELLELFRWHKSLKKPEIRTVGRAYRKLYNEVKHIYEQGVQEYFEIQKAYYDSKITEAPELLSDQRRRHCLKLVLTYDGSGADNTGAPLAVIPAGTKLRARKTQERVAALEDRNRAFHTFSVVFDTPLMPRDYIENVLIPVETVKGGNQNSKGSTLPGEAVLFPCLDEEGKEDTREAVRKFDVKVRTLPNGKTASLTLRSLKNPSRSIFGAKGYLMISAKPGYEIKKGDLFGYEEDGQVYVFAASEDRKITWEQNLFVTYEEETDGEEIGIRKEVELELLHLKEKDTKKKLQSDAELQKEVQEKLEQLDKYILEDEGTVFDIQNVEGKERICSIIAPDHLVWVPQRKVTGTENGTKQEPLTLDITYAKDTEITIPAKSVFAGTSVWKKGKAKCYKADQVNKFYAPQQIVLPAGNEWTIPVPVKFESEAEAEKNVASGSGDMKKFLAEDAVITCIGADGKPLAGVTKVALGEKKPRLIKDGSGLMFVTCQCGTVLDDQCRFIAEYNGNQFSYCLDEKAAETSLFALALADGHTGLQAPVDRVQTQIRVYPYNGKKESYHVFSTTAKGVVIAEADTEFEMKTKLSGVLQIRGTKKLVWVFPEEAEESDYSDDELFVQYLNDIDTNVFNDFTELNLANIRAPWLTRMRIRNLTDEEFAKLSPAQARSQLLTLIFLKVAAASEGLCGNVKETSDIHARYMQFLDMGNEWMVTCRLDDVYFGNPCDCLLAYLLAYDSPVELLRMIFKLNQQ